MWDGGITIVLKKKITLMNYSCTAFKSRPMFSSLATHSKMVGSLQYQIETVLPQSPLLAYICLSILQKATFCAYLHITKRDVCV